MGRPAISSKLRVCSFFMRLHLRRSRRMQRIQNLREKIVAVFSRYLDQAHVRVAPNDGSKRCISLFLHDPENRDHPIQKRPDARGIRIRMALHAANFVHQNQITVLRIRQRGQSRRLKRIRKRRDAERRAADADAVMRIAEQILCCGRMQINRPAAIRLRLCRDSAESPSRSGSMASSAAAISVLFPICTGPVRKTCIAIPPLAAFSRSRIASPGARSSPPRSTQRSPPGSVREYQDRLARECG